MKHALESPLKAILPHTKAKVIVKDILLVTFNNIHLITLSFLPYKVFTHSAFIFSIKGSLFYSVLEPKSWARGVIVSSHYDNFLCSSYRNCYLAPWVIFFSLLSNLIVLSLPRKFLFLESSD